MPFLNLDKFQSSTKRINKYYQHITPDKFDLSPPKKVKEIFDLKDKGTLNENKEIILQKLKVNTKDDDFLSKLVLYSTANKNLLPTEKMLRNQIKKLKKKDKIKKI
jgi:hypothetical protein